jgi:hypothetical protein
LSDSKIRLSINGWFHGLPIVRPKPFIEPKYETHKALGIPLEVVQSWINPLYLEDLTQMEIQTRFEQLSEIVLQDFFNDDKYNELARALKDSEAIDWQWNKRGIMVTENLILIICYSLFPLDSHHKLTQDYYSDLLLFFCIEKNISEVNTREINDYVINKCIFQ